MALFCCEKFVSIIQRNKYQTVMETFIACFNCFHWYRTENKLKNHEKVCNDHDYCCIEMYDEFSKTLKHNYGEMLLMAPFILYADVECLLEKIHSCQNNFKKFYTEKRTNHSPSFWLFNIYKLFVCPCKKQTWLLQW